MSMNTALMMFTVGAMALVVYHHVGYPLLLMLVRHYRQRRSARPGSAARGRATSELPSTELASTEWPSICILMPAYNEAAYIGDKIRNLACLDYPADRLRIILACDGCRDRTAQIARETAALAECQHLLIDIIEFDVNRGKIAVINDVMALVRSDLVALTDVSALISIDALRVAAERFCADPGIGALNGNYILLQAGSEGEATYWRYQRQIKIAEEYLGSVLGAHGAFYLLRRSLFEALPEGTINDDFVLPMTVVAKGYRVAYEARLNALELETSTLSLDWNRRLRISTGNVQQLILLRGLLNPKYGGVALAFASGKGLRVVMPFLLLISLFGSLALGFSSWFFGALFLAQAAVYGTVLSLRLSRRVSKNKWLKRIDYLVCGHAASFIGCVRYFSPSTTRTWS